MHHVTPCHFPGGVLTATRRLGGFSGGQPAGPHSALWEDVRAAEALARSLRRLPI
jgi:hypothetical protein